MNTLKIVTFFITFSIAGNTFAQVNFGLKGGLNLSDYHIQAGYTDDDIDLTTNKRGFHIGGILNYSFTDAFSMETGLLLDTKGSIFDVFSSEIFTNVYYLNVPANFKASYNFNHIKIFGLVGPYGSVALSGSMVDTRAQGSNNHLSFGNSESDYIKRFDFGLSFGTGVEIDRYQISAGYDAGLINLLTDTRNDVKYANRVFRVSAKVLIIK